MTGHPRRPGTAVGLSRSAPPPAKMLLPYRDLVRDANRNLDGVATDAWTAKQVEARIENRLGPREIKRDKSAATAKQWQKAYADWSKPADPEGSTKLCVAAPL